ncbi:MerR family transcriptional regulator [Actinomadura sp. SCN-SB]|uniref:MerR family transcriptional regulator n=1 Tax=Actinomadura sp. SCN-SB TaxID=3373092 RepID=UPI003752D429
MTGHINGHIDGHTNESALARRPGVMTIGDLAAATGVPVKTLRRQQDMGLICTLGRSPAGYRLFDQTALGCVAVIRNLRSLGLTETEIQSLITSFDAGGRLLGPPLATMLRRARARAQARISELQQLQQRIADFERLHHHALTGQPGAAHPWPWQPNPDTCCHDHPGDERHGDGPQHRKQA